MTYLLLRESRFSPSVVRTNSFRRTVISVLIKSISSLRISRVCNKDTTVFCRDCLLPFIIFCKLVHVKCMTVLF